MNKNEYKEIIDNVNMTEEMSEEIKNRIFYKKGKEKIIKKQNNMMLKIILPVFLCTVLLSVTIVYSLNRNNNKDIGYSDISEYWLQMPRYSEVTRDSKDMYVGYIVSIKEEPISIYQEGFSKNEDLTYDAVEYEVKIIEVLKGEHKDKIPHDDKEEYIITDSLPYSFKEYLEVGEKYVFCTGIDYANGFLASLEYPFYEAIKVKSENIGTEGQPNYGLEFYNYEYYTTPNNFGETVLFIECPEDYTHIFEIRYTETDFGNIHFSSCPCCWTEKERRLIRSGYYSTTIEVLICEEHGRDFREKDY